MAQTVAIPGRRISAGETFYTDWMPRGGDCIILRAEALTAAGSGGLTVDVTLETRGEDGSTVSIITPTSTAISLSSVGVGSCLYLASTSTNGAQEEVRVVVTADNTGGESGYYVARIFPLIFFDNAKPI